MAKAKKPPKSKAEELAVFAAQVERRTRAMTSCWDELQPHMRADVEGGVKINDSFPATLTWTSADAAEIGNAPELPHAHAVAREYQRQVAAMKASLPKKLNRQEQDRLMLAFRLGQMDSGLSSDAGVQGWRAGAHKNWSSRGGKNKTKIRDPKIVRLIEDGLRSNETHETIATSVKNRWSSVSKWSLLKYTIPEIKAGLNDAGKKKSPTTK